MKPYRYFILVSFLFLFAFVYAQDVEDDFEGNGNITTWFGDACGINVNYSNPYQQSGNTSATILRYDDTGGQYANVRFDVAENFDLSTYNTFALKIYVPASGLTGNQTNQISLKLQDGTLGEPWVTQSEIIKPISLNQWQVVMFDFENDNYINLDGGSSPPIQRSDFNRIVIQVNGENNFDHVLAYIDDFYYQGNSNTDPVFDALVWSDEFDGNGAINASKWHHQTQLPNGGSWYNGEIQHYTNRTDNAYVSGGFLNIVAKRETFNDQGQTKQFTSARLNSKYAFTNGKVEIRAKLPLGVGTWPALWMLGKNINEDGGYWDTQGFGTTSWPACGEIDIMEHWGDNQNYVQSAMHTPSSFGNTSNLGGQTIPTASTDFHVYTLEWFPDRMVFSVDGIAHYTYEPEMQDASTWPFDAEQYLLFNVAILPNIASSFTESAMQVDYVRVYQESTLSVTELDVNLNAFIYPNPVKDTLNIKMNAGEDQNVELQILNINGRVIAKQSRALNNHSLRYNIAALSQGFYFAKVIFDTGKTSIIKFIKQ